MRLILAIKCFFLVLFARRLPAEAAQLLPRPPKAEEGEPPKKELPPVEAELVKPAEQAPAEKPPVEKVDDGVVQLLAVLQREGRLLDFLQEEIDGYSDAQIGAAVRDIHRGCKKALAEHVPLEPVLREPENSRVRVDAGFDPARIRLVGNIVGEPPFTGTLKHHGWRTAKIALPRAQASDPSVVAPAEVELS